MTKIELDLISPYDDKKHFDLCVDCYRKFKNFMISPKEIFYIDNTTI